MKYIEQYITYDNYVHKYLDKEEPYEGFIIGYGYAYFTYGLTFYWIRCACCSLLELWRGMVAQKLER